jgi:tRNA G18 (ribose-2'-O)-methylase SpoU
MDPRVGLYRGISDRELLRVHGLFVAEGRLVVRRVIADSRYRVHSVLVNDAARRDLTDALEQLSAAVPISIVPTSEFRDLTGYNIHRGCVALVHRPAAFSVDHVLSPSGPVLILEGVANADNVGGIFRNAAAFGAAGVILDAASCDPLYRKAVRTSMGAVLRVPFVRIDGWPEALAQVRASGRQIIALSPREPSVPIDDFAARHSECAPALVLGAEGGGVSAATLASIDATVRIPIATGVDSLNVAVAAGIALYAVTRKRNPGA